MWSSVLLRPVRDLAGWHSRSQVTARRNALVAATALAQRRRERQEVEEFLARYRSGAEAGPVMPEGDMTASV